MAREALTDHRFPGPAMTRAFTGRPGRALVNRFVLDHSSAAPAAYPHVHHLTRDVRRAADLEVR